MRRIAVGAIALIGLVAASGCYAFPHSDLTLDLCANAPGGWSSKACGDSVCVDWHNAYGWDKPCPINIEYATGPR